MFRSEKRPDGRANNTLGGNGKLVSLSKRDKNQAIAKLGGVYGVVLPRWSWDDVSREVAKALQVHVPEDLIARSGMVRQFIRATHTPQPGDDRVALLKAKFPFRPLQLSIEMQRALVRVREFRQIGSQKKD